MSEFYWAEKVGETPGELLLKKQKVEEITSKVIRGSRLSRLIDVLPIPKEVDKGNLPGNIFSFYKERLFSFPRELGYINLYNNHIGILNLKDMNMGTKLTAKFDSAFDKKEWTYSLIKSLGDFPTGHVGVWG